MVNFFRIFNVEYFTNMRDHRRVKIRWDFTFISLKCSFFFPPFSLLKEEAMPKGSNETLAMYTLSEQRPECLSESVDCADRISYRESGSCCPEAMLMTDCAESESHFLWKFYQNQKKLLSCYNLKITFNNSHVITSSSTVLKKKHQKEK